jgi:hypothetical protein
VRFLMRRSLCTPKLQQSFVLQKTPSQSTVEAANKVN